MNNLKVLMQGRYELMTAGGGDKVQIVNTAKELEKLGVVVDIKNTLNVDYSKYDLVHVFQLDWTPETYLYAKKIKQNNKPFILSPIHHSVKEVKRFDDEYTFGYRRVAKFLFKDQHNRDTFKNVYRSFFNPKKMYPTLVSIFKGLKNMHVQTLGMTDMVFVQTFAEAKDLKNTYGVDFDYEKIPNGVGKPFLSDYSFVNTFDFKDYIVCVGRIEPRKNQLNVIKAVKKVREKQKLDVKLVFVGRKSSKKHVEYVHYFNNFVDQNDWIYHLDHVPYDQMPSLYHYAKVGVSASWFETTGLTSLEALFCGANAVASGERAKEYLGDNVSYCQPDDIDSIAKAILKEYKAERPKIDKSMLKEYTWENAAKKTINAYKELLNATS